MLVSSCGTKRQAQSFANIATLLVSAAGGSMVLRFLMPVSLQRLGWMTPTTWTIEGYNAVFRRPDAVAALLLPVGFLHGSGLVGVLGARLLAGRAERI